MHPISHQLREQIQPGQAASCPEKNIPGPPTGGIHYHLWGYNLKLYRARGRSFHKRKGIRVTRAKSCPEPASTDVISRLNRETIVYRVSVRKFPANSSGKVC